MTPQYASPEQIRGDSLTTATDVYLLGVLLYEMLTYHSPYSITGQTGAEVERVVCDSEPLRLSTAARQDARLRRQLSGDLENIMAMALRKEPQRRYSSVQQFADDIQAVHVRTTGFCPGRHDFLSCRQACTSEICWHRRRSGCLL